MAGRLCALLCACSTLWFCATASVRAAPGPLLIGEIGWAGSSKSSADEWLELWNRSTEPVDLNGYSLEGAGGGKDIVFNADDVIAPQSAFLVANYAASDTKSALASDPQVVTTTLSLPNDVLDIKLFDADGTLVDEAGTGGTPPAGFSSSTKASMVRLQDGTWVTANTREHFDDGIADFGTPGSCDGCSWADTSPVDAAAAYPPAATSSESTTTEPLIPETSSPAPEIITITSTPAAVELPVEPVQDIQTNANTEPVIVMVTPPDIRLARVFPAPSSGKEWVELNLPDGADARDWMLYDASGKILTIAASSSHIELNSARLNNGGDTVELRRPDGSVAERMTYPATPRDAYWEKNADQSAWVMVDPNAETTAPQETPEPEIVTTYAPAPPTIELPIATSDTVAGTPSAPETADRTRAIAKPKTSKPKTTAVKKSVPADRAISFDMLTKIEPNVRVAITGVVATKPGIMNKNQFVLLSADGHGLLVYGTTKQVSPPYGATVRVSGTLQLNDDGLSLHLSSKDRWMQIKATTEPQPRLVNFFDALPEDGWSLVSVSATVSDVNQTSATLDLGDLTASLHVKPASGYRLARLKPGDTIRVNALADLRGLDPVLVVRDASDVTILSHAALAKPSNTPQGLPDWTPFGAAGITVAVTQGFKKLKQLREKHHVRALVQKTEALP